MASRPASRGVAARPDSAATAVSQPEESTSSGSGKFYYPDGATYDGQFKLTGLPPPVPEAPTKKGAAKKKEEEPPPPPAEPPKRVRHGTGTYKSGDYWYEGEWADDHMSGQGRFTYASGAAYDGQWLNDKYHGKGRYTWPDGKAYEGDWEDNKMHGTGTFVSADGHRWAGQFFNGAGPGLTCQL